jgi:omega-6 fatty acid desaturase (delta-12 desaturase)
MRDIPELQQAKTTSLKWKDIWGCLRLKVWDPEAQQMIGYREIYAELPVIVYSATQVD